MIYALVVVCHFGGCTSFTDKLGPYQTAGECEARLDEMRDVIGARYGQMPGFEMGAMCGPLMELRRVVPGVYEGEIAA